MGRHEADKDCCVMDKCQYLNVFVINDCPCLQKYLAFFLLKIIKLRALLSFISVSHTSVWNSSPVATSGFIGHLTYVLFQGFH